jgi:cell division protein FtsW
MKAHLADFHEDQGSNSPETKISTFEMYRYVLAIILLLGIVMVYSSSYIYAKETLGSSTYFIVRHLTFCIVGIFSALVLGKTKLKFWLKTSLFFHWVVVLFLVFTFIPGIGVGLNGAQRWIGLGIFKFQPSELVKYSMILISVKFFEGYKSFDRNAKIVYLASMTIPLGLLLFQPDFGSLSIIVATVFYVGFLSDFPRKLYYSLLALCSTGVIALIFSAPYRIQRVLTYLDPWKDPKNSGFQIIQSYLAFAHGSIFGQGIGNSSEKLFYLPEAYNDFIFSVVGEELGFVGVTSVIILFISLTYLGFKIAAELKMTTTKLIVAAVTFLITFQAFLNMGVVLGILPTKGLNLPFISYGGTSLISNLLGVGIIMSAIRYDREGAQEQKQQFVQGNFSSSQFRSQYKKSESFQ